MAFCSAVRSLGTTTWTSTYWSPRRPPRTSGMPFPASLNDCPCWVPAGILRPRVGEQQARAAAGRARGLGYERPEDRLLGAPDLPRAPAAWAGLGSGSGLGTTT